MEGIHDGKVSTSKKLKVPNIYDINESDSKMLISFYDAKNLPGINSIVNKIIA